MTTHEEKLFELMKKMMLGKETVEQAADGLLAEIKASESKAGKYLSALYDEITDGIIKEAEKRAKMEAEAKARMAKAKAEAEAKKKAKAEEEAKKEAAKKEADGYQNQFDLSPISPKEEEKKEEPEKTEEQKAPVPEIQTVFTQYKILFYGILCTVEEDPEYERKLFLPWKSWNRLCRFVEEKVLSSVYQGARSSCVDGFTLLAWVKEYYFLDDKEQVEKEEEEKKRKAEEAEKRKAEEAKKDAARKKRLEKQKAAEAAKKAEAEEGSSYVEDDEEDASDEDSAPSVTEAPKAAEKPNKKECSGQIDLFSLFG